MEYLFLSLMLLMGAAIIRKRIKFRRMCIPKQREPESDALQHIKKKEDRWQLGKTGHGRVRYISSRLKESKDTLIGCMN